MSNLSHVAAQVARRPTFGGAKITKCCAVGDNSQTFFGIDRMGYYFGADFGYCLAAQVVRLGVGSMP